MRMKINSVGDFLTLLIIAYSIVMIILVASANYRDSRSFNACASACGDHGVAAVTETSCTCRE